MNLSEEHYERIARRMDGEDLSLSPREEAVAEEVRGDLAGIGAALEAVTLPPGVMHRVHARMRRELPARSRLRWGAGALAACAAAAAVIVAVALWPGPSTQPRPISTEAYVHRLTEPPASALDVQVSLLSDEISNYHAELTLGQDWEIDLALAGLESEVDGPLLDEFAPVPPEEEGLEEW